MQIYELSWFNHYFIILSQFSTMPKKAKIRSINAKKDKSKSIKLANKWNQWYIKTDSKLLNWLTINIIKWGSKKKVVENTIQRPEIPYTHSGIFSVDSKYRL